MRNTLMAVAAAGAMAVSTSAFGQAEVSISDQECVVLDAEGIPASAGEVIVPLLPTALGGDGVVQIVVTPKGDIKLTCNGTLPAGALPERSAVVHDFNSTGGLKCRKPDGEGTEEWHEVVTPSGNVALTCHFRE